MNFVKIKNGIYEILPLTEKRLKEFIFNNDGYKIKGFKLNDKIRLIVMKDYFEEIRELGYIFKDELDYIKGKNLRKIWDLNKK